MHTIDDYYTQLFWKFQVDICWNNKTTADWNLTISHFSLLRNNDASDKNFYIYKVVKNSTLNTVEQKKFRKKQEKKIIHANLQKLKKSLWPWTETYDLETTFTNR